MEYIKESGGIDFVINGKSLTDRQKHTVSDFIKADKERLKKLAQRKAKARNNSALNKNASIIKR